METEEVNLPEFNLTEEDNAALDEFIEHSVGNSISKTSHVPDQQNNKVNINGFEQIDFNERQRKDLREKHSFDFSSLTYDDSTKKSFEKTNVLNLHQKIIFSDKNSLTTRSNRTSDNLIYSDGYNIEDDVFEDEVNSLSADSTDEFLNNLENEIDELDCKSLIISSLTDPQFSQSTKNKEANSSPVESNNDMNFTKPGGSDQTSTFKNECEKICTLYVNNKKHTNYINSFERKKLEDEINNKETKNVKSNNKLYQDNSKRNFTSNLWLPSAIKNESELFKVLSYILCIESYCFQFYCFLNYFTVFCFQFYSDLLLTKKIYYM